MGELVAKAFADVPGDQQSLSMEVDAGGSRRIGDVKQALEDLRDMGLRGDHHEAPVERG